MKVEIKKEDLVELEELLKDRESRMPIELIKKLVEKASPTELKYLLLLERIERTGGCGYLYLFEESVEIVYGKGEIVTLELSRPEECLWREKLMIVPYSVPVVVIKKYHDDNPEVNDFIEVFVFTSEGWKSLRGEIPK